MVPWPALVVLVVHGTLGKPKSMCMRLAFITTECFLFPYSIVIGEYYSGDARYLVVSDYSMLQLFVTGYKLVMDYASHGYSFSADCSGSVQLPHR